MKKNCFRRYDFLNVPTSLSYKKEYFYATNVGAILTICFILIILSLIIYQIIILYKRSSFKLISNQYTDLLESIDFSKMPILFQLINSNNKVMDFDKKLYELIVYNMESYYITYENGTKRRRVKNTKVELDKCDKILSNNSDYSMINLSDYMCFKPGQNMTAFGLLGDKNNLYKGIRIYINKCNGPDCYDDSKIEDEFHNAKFYLYYLSLSSNMFYLNNNDIEYQLYTKFCSLSTKILKKIVFTFDIGRFHLYNNILYKRNVSFNYLLGNDYSLDIDIDPTSTLAGDEYTIAYISFHYGGKIFETIKEVQTLIESLTTIGNFFNIILTIFKVINNYYSTKILFVDIFSNIFFNKEKYNFEFRNNFHFNNSINLNTKNNKNKKMNLNDSGQIGLNNNIINNQSNKNNSIKEILSDLKSKTDKKPNHKRKSQIKFDKKGNTLTKTKIFYYYIFPIWLLKKNKKFYNIYKIKEKICGYFSIEKINELIKFKENIEDISLKSKIKNNELIEINNNYDKNSLENNKKKNGDFNK